MWISVLQARNMDLAMLLPTQLHCTSRTSRVTLRFIDNYYACVANIRNLVIAPNALGTPS